MTTDDRSSVVTRVLSSSPHIAQAKMESSVLSTLLSNGQTEECILPWLQSSR